MRTAVRVLANRDWQQDVVPNGMDCEAGQASSTVPVTGGSHPRHRPTNAAIARQCGRSQDQKQVSRGNAAVSHCLKPGTLRSG